ncbi:DUF3558 family protein [Nocardia sp. NPDC051750]|uniref:DUF3558 family protein n=1 Tax=Nocardia sp. NPDC051750 TaxID=3364325 RepID=UPI0037956171
MTLSARSPAHPARSRMLWCGLVVAASLGAGACGSGEATDPAAVWDPCTLPARLLGDAGFPAGSARRDVATETGWAGCGWSSGEAAVRVLFTTEGSPGEVGGPEDIRTEVTLGNRTGQRLHTGPADTATTCTVVLPTEDGGLIRVRVDSVPAEGGACARAERAATVLEPALPT